MSAIDMKFEALHDVLLAGRRENQDGFHKVNENISNIMNVQILLCRDVAMLKEESAALRAENLHMQGCIAALKQGHHAPDPTTTLEMKWVMEGSADLQQQKEQMGKIALLAPTSHGLPEVASMLGVQPNSLSWASNKQRGVVLLHLATPVAAQRWLSHYRGAGGMESMRAWLLCCSSAMARCWASCNVRCSSVGTGYRPTSQRTGWNSF